MISLKMNCKFATNNLKEICVILNRLVLRNLTINTYVSSLIRSKKERVSTFAIIISQGFAVYN